MNKLIKNTVLVLVLTLFAGQVGAAECHIILYQVAKPCNNVPPAPPGTIFRDGDGLAQISPKRCMERALDYHRWCGYTPQDAVGSYYKNSQGAWTSATVTYGFLDYLFIVNDLGHFEYVRTVRN